MIKTERLILRTWRDKDRRALVKINHDPRVMEAVGGIIDERTTYAWVDRAQNHIKIFGYGMWACVLKETDECVGFVGLRNLPEEMPFSPCVEIGWRLAYEHWDKGYATEAAKAAVAAAFKEFDIDELVAFTYVDNVRSRRVMEKLGMVTDPAEDFSHPQLDEGHPLRHHVLYRLRKK